MAMLIHTLLENSQLPSLIMFDLDGTLVNSIPDLTLAVNSTLKKYGQKEITEKDVGQWVGNGMFLLLKRAFAKNNNCAEEDVSNADVEKCIHIFMKEYEVFNFKTATLFPGVLECLQKAQALNIRMAVVTNKPKRFVPKILQGLDIEKYFQYIVGGDCLPEKKPHPMPLIHCMQHFKASHSETIMVGDSMHDIGAARKANVPVVAVTYGYNHGEPITKFNPNVVVNSLAELF